MRFLIRGLLAAGLLWSGQVYAQQEELIGVVIEEGAKGNLVPLYAVNVYWLGTTQGATTDSNGVFRIPWKGEGKRLVVSYIGYANDTILIRSNEMITVMLKNSRTVGDVTVTYREKSSKTSFLDPIQTELISEKELFKAACCNLSESFETTPSVDVSYTDALTGTREIKMLGLAGRYSLISQEAMPALQGMGTFGGMSYIPGTWVESIQLSKGTGSVVNGHEAMTGQINFCIKDPDGEEKLHINSYANQDGRVEQNFNLARTINEKWSIGILAHGEHRQVENDRNKDGFLDRPLNYSGGYTGRLRYKGPKGLRFQGNLMQFYRESEGGQFGDEQLPYRYGLFTSRVNAWGKLGYLFPQKKYRSIGSQYSYVYQDQVSRFGIRRHTGTEERWYANVIYQSIIGNTFHKFKTGPSFSYNVLRENFEQRSYTRIESVPGAYFEYTYDRPEKLTLVTGIRADHHNEFGLFVTPRIHARFPLAERTIARLTAGSGWRTPNAFADNLGLLASSRAIDVTDAPGVIQVLPPIPTDQLYNQGLEPEVAYNAGFSLVQDFILDFREGQVVFDFYHTTFQNKVVVDMEQARVARIYNLENGAFSNSFAFTASWEILRKMDVKFSYRWFEIRTETYEGEVDQPMNAKHRLFANWAYETRKRWVFDVTANWIGEKRLPDPTGVTAQHAWDTKSPSYFLVNTQVTKKFGSKWSFYVGAENVFNYRQPDPIVAVGDPFGPDFDATMVWGPVFGRMLYGGFRFRIVDE